MTMRRHGLGCVVLCIALLAAGCTQLLGLDQIPPHCHDKVRNGDEADVDCGGTCALRCDAGASCREDGDCASNACQGGHCCTPPCAAWCPRFGSEGETRMRALANDRHGGLIAAGSFRHSLDLGQGPLQGAGDAGRPDIFLARIDEAGRTSWSRRYGDAREDEPSAVAADQASLFLAGSFQGTLDIGTGPLFSSGSNRLFLARFTPGPEAQPLWLNAYGDDRPKGINALALDTKGNVVLTGTFQGSIDFGCGPRAGRGGNDIFLARLSPGGVCLDTWTFGGEEDQDAFGLALDSRGRIVLTGRFARELSFGGATARLRAADDKDMFLAIFDPNGVPIFSRAYGGVGYQVGWSVAVGQGDELLLTGSFTLEIKLGPGHEASGPNVGNVFLARMAADYSGPRWSHFFRSTRGAVGESVAVDLEDNAWVTGIFDAQGSLMLGDRRLEGMRDHSSYDTFLARYDSAGRQVWVTRYATRIPGYDQTHQDVYQKLAPLGGNMVLGGVYMYKLDFGCGEMKPSGPADLFLVRLAR